jgi:hypothetical protein
VSPSTKLATKHAVRAALDLTNALDGRKVKAITVTIDCADTHQSGESFGAGIAGG